MMNHDKALIKIAPSIDAFAMIIAIDMIANPEDHDEFDIDDYESIEDAIRSDIEDMIHNANEFDWIDSFDVQYDDDDIRLIEWRKMMQDDRCIALIASFMQNHRRMNRFGA